MFHTPSGGGTPVLHYSQSRYSVNNGDGYRREYHFGTGTTYRYYAPMTWGTTGYLFYGYQYGRHQEWSNGYYGYCHGEWRPDYYGYNYDWQLEGWHTHEWYRHYHYYFPLYAEYRSPAYWITDWYLGALLSDYYAIREAESFSYYDSSYALDYSTKEILRAQVRQAMIDQQYGTLVPVYYYLNTSHLYVVSEYTPVRTADGYTCALSHGDVIQQSGYSYEGQQTLNMIVIRSKRGSCYPNSIVHVDVSLLQEYQNDFNARVELGMSHNHNRFFDRRF